MSLLLDLVMWFCTVYLVVVVVGGVGGGGELLAESDSETIVRELVLHTIMYASCCCNKLDTS